MNLGKTYAKLRIFPTIFGKSGTWSLALMAVRGRDRWMWTVWRWHT